jgi:hypothetical protein
VRVVFLEPHPLDSNRAQIPGIDEALPISGALSIDQVRGCLYRSVTISDRRIVQKLNGAPPPASFRNSPLLCEHRLLLVGADRAVVLDDQVIRLHPRLGIVIENLA